MRVLVTGCDGQVGTEVAALSDETFDVRPFARLDLDITCARAIERRLEEAMPDVEPLTLPMEKGDVLLMNKEIPHRSTPNNTDTVRWSMDLRYQKTGTPTGRPFYPDFVVRSRSNPDSVLTDHGEWARMWEEALAAEASRGAKHHRWEVVPAKS